MYRAASATASATCSTAASTSDAAAPLGGRAGGRPRAGARSPCDRRRRSATRGHGRRLPARRRERPLPGARRHRGPRPSGRAAPRAATTSATSTASRPSRDERGFWQQRHAAWCSSAAAGRSSTRPGASGCSTSARRRSGASWPGSSAAGPTAAPPTGSTAVEFDNLDSFTRSHGLLDRGGTRSPSPGCWSAARTAADLAAGQKNLAGFDGTRSASTSRSPRSARASASARRTSRLRPAGAGDRVPHARLPPGVPEVRRPDLRVVLRDRDLTPDAACAGGADPGMRGMHSACTPRRWATAGRPSSSATGCSARARTGPRSPRRSRTTTGCCWSTCPTTAARRGPSASTTSTPPTRWPGCSSADDPVALVGHSMGGKAAMVLALRHPELVERLCVVDVAPVAYAPDERVRRLHRRHAGARPRLARPRSDADAALAEAVPNPTVRSFLLQNLRRDGDGWRWQPNLDVLGPRPGEDRRLARGRSWPAPRRTTVRCCGSAAQNSTTCATEYVAAMDRWFPRNRG